MDCLPNKIESSLMLIAHYTTTETALAHIIPQQRLRFCLLESTNDPYEARYDNHAGRSAFGGSEEQVDAILRSNTQTRNEIRKKNRIACFAANETGSAECGNVHPLWTYYASGKGGLETGCALMFDLGALLEKITQDPNVELEWNGPITYVPPTSLRGDMGIITAKKLFSIKSNAWVSEQEYRIMIKQKIESEGPLTLNITGCLRGLVLSGSAINCLTSTYMSSVSAVCKAEVKFYRRNYNSVRHESEMSEVTL
jgi:hypothetical protein